MITHVAELRLHNMDERDAKQFEAKLRSICDERTEIAFHDAKVNFQWKPPQMGDDKPSDSQMWYARKLYKELRGLAAQILDPELEKKAKQLGDDVAAEMNSGTIGKRNISPIIDAMKEAIADLQFAIRGVRALDE